MAVGQSVRGSKENFSSEGKEGLEEAAKDVLHFVRPKDTITSLSLLYRVPPAIIRSCNRLFSDHLLLARQAIIIPGTHYCGPSLSATPVGGEAEETRKSKLKRFQIRTKCVNFEMAEFYLDDAGWDERKAEEKWWLDERWVQSARGRGR